MGKVAAMMMLVGSLLGDAPATKKPQREQDTDCVLAYRCTCECCPRLEAMTKGANRAERSKCARAGSCGGSDRCSQEPCAKPANPAFWQAVCREGRCGSERKPAKAADAGHP